MKGPWAPIAGLVFFLLLIYLLSAAGPGGQAQSGPRVLTVGAGGDHATIQAAVDNASEGDTIEVLSGVYDEQVVVEKQLTIRGDGDEGGSVLNGSGRYFGLQLKANGCIVDGMTVVWAYFGYGIAVEGDNCKITNCYTIASYCGIYVNNAKGVIVQGCDLSHNTMAGVALNASSDCMVLDTVIEHNNAYIGDPSGVLLYNSSDNLILNCTIQLIYGDGIALYAGSGNNGIADCDLRFNMNGIDIQNSNGNTISANICDSNMNGIYVSGSRNIDITENICNKNTNGILLETAQECTLEKNICNNNDAAGVYLASARGNDVAYNTIENNSVSLTHGIFVNGNSTQNSLHHNILKNNNHGNVQAIDNGHNNSWDLDGEGNFWLDWTVPDKDLDGIVDEPYELGGVSGAEDRFPLTRPPGSGSGPENPSGPGAEDNGTVDGGVSPLFFVVLGCVLIVIIIALLAFRRLRGGPGEGPGGPGLRQI